MKNLVFHPGRFGYVLVTLLLVASVVSAEPAPGVGPSLLPPDRFELATPSGSFSLGADLRDTPARLWRTLGELPSRDNLPVFALGAGWSYVASAEWDHPVRHEMKEHTRSMGGANDVFSIAGHPLAHMGATALLYSTSLLADDRRLHDFTVDLFDAFVITDVSNQSLKYMFDSERPNGQPYGFPSGHTASSFAFASVVHDHFGLLPGMAAYGLAGMVGWHRIDAQHHELSDVLAGALVGYMVGTSVTGSHNFLSGNPRIIPYSNFDGGGTGVAIELLF